MTRQTSAPWHAASFRWLTRLAVAALVFIPYPSLGHPLGNFSISQYTAIRVDRDALEFRYLIDLAEIPTFQEIQDTGLVTEVGHPSVHPYLARKVETLKEGLRLEVDGVRLPLQTQSSDVIFPPGAGDLPTMKLGVVYRAFLPSSTNATRSLHYQDGNFPDRVGWKEIIAVARPGVTLARSTVPSRDRSRELADYPTDLMDSPPGDREARLVFTIDPLPLPAASMPPSPSPPGPSSSRATVASGPRRQGERVTPDSVAHDGAAGTAPTRHGAARASRQRRAAPSEPALRLEANKRTTPRNALTDLVKTKELSFGIIVIALAVASVSAPSMPWSRATARPSWPPILLAHEERPGTRSSWA